MSIASAIQNARTKIEAAYSACESKKAKMPTSTARNLANLPATIRSIMGSGVNLPNGYTQYDYLQCDANAYINTGITATEPMSFYVRFSHCATSGDYVFVGARGSGETRMFPVAPNSTNINYGYGGYQTVGYSFSTEYSNRTPIEVKTILSNGFQSRDAYSPLKDASMYSASVSYAVSAGVPFYIFRNNYSSASHCPSGDRLYEIKIYDDARFRHLVFHGIPCINSSGTSGLYELVSGTFLDNAGSGSFTVGND